MQVHLLGTGAADGLPSPFCECATCLDARRRRSVRRPTAALVDDVILLDVGPTVPSAAATFGRSLRTVHHIVVTHAHSDHLDPAILLWLSWVPTPHTVHLWGPVSAIEACERWVGPTTPIQLHSLGPNEVVELATPQGTWLLRTWPAAHDSAEFGGHHDAIAAETVLLDLTDPRGSRLLYATDTGPLPVHTVHALRDAHFDIALIEETFGDHTTHATGHLDLASLGPVLDSLRSVGAITDRTDVIAVHLGHHNPPESLLRARLATYGVRLVADGARIGGSHRTLLLGGARSGKSHEAERRASGFRDVVYVAAAEPRTGDPEWDERVAIHRQRRPTEWHTQEGHLAVAPAIRASTAAGAVIIDCLTLWLTGVLDTAAGGADWSAVDRVALAHAAESATDDLVDALQVAQGTILLVSNEVGMGVVAPTAAGRLFADLLGRTNQRVAAACEETLLMVAGGTIAVEARHG